MSDPSLPDEAREPAAIDGGIEPGYLRRLTVRTIVGILVLGVMVKVRMQAREAAVRRATETMGLRRIPRSCSSGWRHRKLRLREQAPLDNSCVPSGVPYRSASRTPTPKIRGPQTAVVVGKAGEEIWTDEYSRVKLQFRWDREGGSDENSSCWVRVAQIWSGGGWGGTHVPRIGQEVIVEFLEGDPDRPIVTGRVYNADKMPPYALPDNQTQSGIKTRSSPDGTPDNYNELRFEDKKGSEQVYLQAEKIHSETGLLALQHVLVPPGSGSTRVDTNLGRPVLRGLHANHWDARIGRDARGLRGRDDASAVDAVDAGGSGGKGAGCGGSCTEGVAGRACCGTACARVV